MEIKERQNYLGGFPINQKLAGIVPMAVPSEQAVLTAHIKDHGQKEPIVLWKGEVVDGRCRQTALVSLGRHILYRELDDALSEEEVKVFVKAVNTRRNLTTPQKIAVACKYYADNKQGTTVKDVAKAWGIGELTLKNALYVLKIKPEYIEAIFNGGSVLIKDKKGSPIESNKITAIYAYLKKEEELVEEVDKAWGDNKWLKSQAAKEWYYTNLPMINNEGYIRMMLSELANYKFPLDKEETV